jgi:hypothetical protein
VKAFRFLSLTFLHRRVLVAILLPKAGECFGSCHSTANQFWKLLHLGCVVKWFEMHVNTTPTSLAMG